jgi:endo-beta-N-acetylglucosaminidase D
VNPDYRPDAVNPTIVDYSNAFLPEPATTDENGLRDDQPTVFLIALTDHTVVAAIAYWVDDDTLNWISRDAKQNRMSLSLVDRDFSKQLNDERHVEFKLPLIK